MRCQVKPRHSRNNSLTSAVTPREARASRPAFLTEP